MPAIDLPPPSFKKPELIHSICDVERYSKSRAILCLQAEDTVLRPSRRFEEKVYQILNKVSLDFVDKAAKENTTVQQFDFLLNSVFSAFVVLYKFNFDHLGVEYTLDESIYFFAKKSDVSVHLEVYMDWDNYSVFKVVNVFEGEEFVVNTSFENLQAFNKILEELFPGTIRVPYLEFARV